MSGDTGANVGRRTALRIISAAVPVVAVFGLTGGHLRAQVEVELTKQPKDRAKAFAQVRTEWGLKPAAVSETDMQPVVGDELTEGLQSFDEVVDVLVARLRRPLEFIDRHAHGGDERERWQHATLDAEARLRRSVSAFARSEVSLSEARAEVRQTFADYLEHLEAAPRQ